MLLTLYKKNEVNTLNQTDTVHVRQSIGQTSRKRYNYNAPIHWLYMDSPN